MKRKVAEFKQWGERIPIYDRSLKFHDFCYDNKSHLTPLGLALLNFIWCRYHPIYVDILKREYPEKIYLVVPGILPKLFRRKNGIRHA